MVKSYLLDVKDRVSLTYDSEDKGSITKVGEFVSEVKFDRGVTRFIRNVELKKEKND